MTNDALELLRKFKFSKSRTIDALIMKIDKTSMLIERDQLIEGVCLDELGDELPSYEPRYVMVQYQYGKPDGRTVYPYCMIYSIPQGSPPNLKMLYAASLTNVVKSSEVGKVYELTDTEDFNEKWLKDQLENDR